MKYLVIETCNGELSETVACFNSINEAEKFIESCAFATNKSWYIENPVIEIVSDFYEIPSYVYEATKKRFGKCTIY